MRFCSQCGVANPADARFCASCGTTLGATTEAAYDRIVVDVGAGATLPPKGMSPIPVQDPAAVPSAAPAATGASDWLVGPLAGLAGGLVGGVLVVVLGPLLEELDGEWQGRVTIALRVGLQLALVAAPAGFAVLGARWMLVGDPRRSVRRGGIGATSGTLAAVIAAMGAVNLFYSAFSISGAAFWGVQLTCTGMLFGLFATWFGRTNRGGAALGLGALGGFVASLPALLEFSGSAVWTLVLSAAIGAGLGLVLPALTRRERAPRYAMVPAPGFVPAYAVPVAPVLVPSAGAAQPMVMSGVPMTGYVAAPVSTNGLAVAALVFGILGGFLLAIIFGFVAKSQIKRSAGLQGGGGMATAGIVLGFVWLGLWIAFYALIIGIAASAPSSVIGALW